MKKTLVLGAGLVARPLVRYLLDHPNIQVLIASRTVSKAENLIADHPQGEAVEFDITKDIVELPNLVEQADIIISLLPYVYHVTIAEECIRQKKHLVTTSYVSDAMNALNEKAKIAEVILLNELGLDPGIDHMSAMKIINDVRDRNGKIESFSSYCGGLPAPEANTNPFGYKLSWSPLGVLLAGRNPACFLKEGKQVDIPGEELFAHYEIMEVEGLGDFEFYPNRNSLGYIDLYGIQETQTMFRGTLRNLEWCDTLKAIADLGLLNDQIKHSLKDTTYTGFMRKLINVDPDSDLKVAIASKLAISPDSEIIKKLEWLSLLSDDTTRMDEGSPLDVLAARFMEKLQYNEGERDMVILIHEFIAKYPDERVKITSTLVDYGIPYGDSSMSRTVSLPAAIGARLILEGKITSKGVQIPTIPEIYKPILAELEQLGIVCKEKAVTV